MTETALLIAGPTASGKSALALALAEQTGACVINADSMQVYADLLILTARPGGEDVARAPHRLYGCIDAAERYSTARWLAAACAELDAARAQDRPVIFVGGTGLYFKALTEGLSPIPQPSSEARAKVAALFEAEGVRGLRAAAESADPDATRQILGLDRQRLTRLLEVCWGTDRTMTAWRAASSDPPLRPGAWRGLVLERDVATLDARIAARARRMLTSQAAEEVRTLLARGLDPDLPAMKAIGVAAVQAMLDGDASADETAARIALESRRYAKRQRTWFRNQMRDWRRAVPDDVPAAAAIWVGASRPSGDASVNRKETPR